MSLHSTNPSNIDFTNSLDGSKHPVGNSFFNHGNSNAYSAIRLKALKNFYEKFMHANEFKF